MTLAKTPLWEREPRPLPIDVAPIAGETAASYVRRLAGGNALDPELLLPYLGRSQEIRTDPWSSHDLVLNPAAAHRLAIYSNRPLDVLTHALTGLMDDRLKPVITPRRQWRSFAASNAPVEACRPCTAHLRGTGPVLVRLQPHQWICPRHQRWLNTPAGQPQTSIAGLSEVLRAHHRHLRLIHRRGSITARAAFNEAAELIRGWPATAIANDVLAGRWHRRAAGLPNQERSQPRLVRYPEIVTVAVLLSGRRWANAVLAPRNRTYRPFPRHAEFLAAAAETLDDPSLAERSPSNPLVQWLGRHHHEAHTATTC